MLAGVTRALAGPKRAYPDQLPGSHDVCFADNPLPAGIEPHFPPCAAAWTCRSWGCTSPLLEMLTHCCKWTAIVGVHASLPDAVRSNPATTAACSTQRRCG